MKTVKHWRAGLATRWCAVAVLNVSVLIPHNMQVFCQSTPKKQALLAALPYILLALSLPKFVLLNDSLLFVSNSFYIMSTKQTWTNQLPKNHLNIYIYYIYMYSWWSSEMKMLTLSSKIFCSWHLFLLSPCQLHG